MEGGVSEPFLLTCCISGLLIDFALMLLYDVSCPLFLFLLIILYSYQCRLTFKAT
jgi:hypothetical protein